MSFRTEVLSLVDIMMRVPPILVIDEILKIGMGLSTQPYTQSSNFITSLEMNNSDSASNELNEGNLTRSALHVALRNASESAASDGVLSSSFGVLMSELVQDTDIFNVLTMTSIRFLFCIIGLMGASCIFMLWTRHLVMVYVFVSSLALTLFSYWTNVSALTLMLDTPSILEELISMKPTRLLDSGGIVMTIVPHLVMQWIMGMLFACLHLGPRYTLLQKSMPFIFASPIILALFPIPAYIREFLPLCAAFIPLALIKISLFGSAYEVGKTVLNGYQYAMNFISNFGLSALIENEWQRLNVPIVLRIFWTIRIGRHFCSIASVEGLSSMSLLPTVQKLLVDGCETLTAVLGMTSMISAICHYIGKVFQWYLLTFGHDGDKSLGTVSAVLFYILALQTGLTSLAPEKRFVRLCRNLCLLVTALLHFLHNIVCPIMMSLSASRNPSRKRHIRALSVCAFLLAAPIGLLSVLWERHSLSTWLLAVTAFSVEVVVKTLVSLATYTLFLIDARRQSFWEKLDDYLYYVRAFGNSVEFCFGIFLFFNGAWILIFESAQNATGGAIRAIMMCIHAYFNIWCEARAGWSVFMKRRMAVHKISSLPEATPAQLRAVDDVCAICYQEMYAAKITRCRHFFHGVCLRKWLYVQDRCPLCHEIMIYTEKSETNAENNAQSPDNPIEQLVQQVNAPEVRLNPPEARSTHSAGNTIGTSGATTSVRTNSAQPNDSNASSSSPTVTTAAAFTTFAASNSDTFRFQADVAPQN